MTRSAGPGAARSRARTPRLLETGVQPRCGEGIRRKSICRWVCLAFSPLCWCWCPSSLRRRLSPARPDGRSGLSDTPRPTAEHLNTPAALDDGKHAQVLGDRPLPAALEPFQHNPCAYEELNQRMIALARRLRKSYRTALLSNATLYLDTLLVDHDLAGVFDVIVNSARVGLRKPDPQIYRLTLDRLRLVPTQCLFIDDKKRNTLVAQSLGMKVIVFRSVADLMRRLRAAGGCVF